MSLSPDSTVMIFSSFLVDRQKIDAPSAAGQTRTSSQKTDSLTSTSPSNLNPEKIDPGRQAWATAKKLLTDRAGVFSEMVALYTQRTLARIFSLSDETKTLEITDSALGKLPKSGENNPNKQLSEQQTKLRESQVQVEGTINLLKNNSKLVFDAQDTQFANLIKLGALKSTEVANSQPVRNQIKKENENIKKIDNECKIVEKKGSELSVDVSNFAKLVKKRAPEQVIATMQDQQKGTRKEL